MKLSLKDKPLKIACVSSTRIPSETANSIQVMKVCQALSKMGYSISLIVPRADNVIDDSQLSWESLAAHYGLSAQFEVIALKRSWGKLARRFFPWRAVWKALRIKSDVIYAWLSQSAAGGLLARRPVFLEMHDLPTGRFGGFWYRLFLRLPGRKRMLPITQALADALQQKFSPPLQKDQIVISPNGVDLERFDDTLDPPTARHELGLPDKMTVACTGHLYSGRGAELFLELAVDLPQYHFLWVGGRPNDVERWRNKLRESGLGNVTFAGFISNKILPRYQAAAEILLMPYRKDMGASSGQNPDKYFNPMKMFDYMAAGRPIITSNLPVIREILDEEKAVFCPPQDVAAWSKAITQLMKDSEKREILGQRAREEAAQYTWIERAKKGFQDFI